jgi:hypothetical protein
MNKENLPAPTDNASQTASLVTGIGTALAAIWFPAAALAQPVISLLIERYTKRPEKILLDRIREGDLEMLSEDQLYQFVPTAYRFYEASKAAEYERNLKIFGEFIVNELKQPQPSAGNFLKMARQLEGISEEELCVLALSEAAMKEIDSASPKSGYMVGQAFVAASTLAERDDGSHRLSRDQIAGALHDLASRGLLTPDGASRLDKAEEYYMRSFSLRELLSKAKSAFDQG